MKKLFCFIIYDNGKCNVCGRKIVEDLKNIFRLKKEQNDTAIKD